RRHRRHLPLDHPLLSDCLPGDFRSHSPGARQLGRSRSNVGCEQLDRLADGHPATHSSGYDGGVHADLRLESFGFWATSAAQIARSLYTFDDACDPVTILTIVLKSTARSFGHLYGADGSSLGGPVCTARPRPINPNRSLRIDQTLSNRC